MLWVGLMGGLMYVTVFANLVDDVRLRHADRELAINLGIYELAPRPQTQNPKPYTLHSIPHTLHSRHYTLNLRPGMQAKKRMENRKAIYKSSFTTAAQVALLVFQRTLAARRGAARRAARRAARISSVLRGCRGPGASLCEHVGTATCNLGYRSAHVRTEAELAAIAKLAALHEPSSLQ